MLRVMRKMKASLKINKKKQKKNSLDALLRHWYNRSPVMFGSSPEESVFWQHDESKGEEPDGYTLFVLSV